MAKGGRGGGRGAPVFTRPVQAPGVGPAAQVPALFAAAVQAHQLGRIAEAEQRYLHVLALDPNHADALHNLGVLVGGLGRHDIAAGLLAKAAGLKKREPGFQVNLGVALKGAGRLDEAAAAFRRAISLNPAYASAHHTLGDILRDQGKADEALVHARRAVALGPSEAKFHISLGATLQLQDKLTEAAAAYRRAIALQPGLSEAHNDLGDVLAHQGYIDEAVTSYERALRLKPDNVEADSRRLVWLGYSPRIDAAGLLAEHRRWDERHGARGRPRPAYPNDRDPQRRLRIGFVSGHLRSHPVGFFLAKVLEARDPAAVEVFCYALTVMVDHVTERLRGASDHWRNCVNIPEAEVAAQIGRDEIDILVDLSGHTPGNQLTLFTRRPAPVQASWLGYPSTTGLSAIDYLVMDAAAFPPGAEAFCSEAVVRLPYGRFCYAPPDYAPEPAPPPSASRGEVTFGSFNQLTKISPDVVRLWTAVLAAVPESRLVLKWVALGDPTARDRLVQAFAEAGLAPERLELRGHSPHDEMLAQYADIDIALDPFPFCGGLTSCEALWMGVPVVTLPGERPASRQTLGFLQALDLADLAAGSEADYVRIAANLAADIGRRTELRTGLRSRMAASPLCDATTFTPTLEAAWRGMWRRWCAGEPPAGFDVPAP